MRKPIVRYSEGYLCNPAGLPYGRLVTCRGEFRETSRAVEVKYSEKGDMIRLETRNTIYVKVAQ